MRKHLLTLCMLLLSTAFALAQTSKVSGVVISTNDGETLPGVTVTVLGSSIRTSTDMDGKYSIDVPEGVTQLQFTFIGMTPKTVSIGDQKNINVAMEPSMVGIKEIVVDALGFERKKDEQGNASTTIDGGTLINTGDSRLINSISGKSAGVNIVQATGDPGAGSSIQIRGATSITGDMEPLIILDGIPIFNDSYYGQGYGGNVAGSSGSLGSGGGVTQQSRLNDINPDDIESIEVLRGAAAAAIWGSRAANGVLMITTKKGKFGKADKKFTVSLNSSIAFDNVNKRIPLNEQFGQGLSMQYGGQSFASTSLSWGDRISHRAGGEDAYITDPDDPNYAGYFESKSGNRYYALEAGDSANPHGGKNSTTLYDPYEMLFKTGITANNSISLSSADENGSVYFSFGDLRQDGVIKANSNYKKNNIRLNVTRYLGDVFTVTGNAGYSRVKSNRVQMGSNLNGLFLGGLRSAADFNDEDYAGSYFDTTGIEFADRQRAYRNPLGAEPNSIYDNPLWMMNNITSENVVDRFTGKLEIGADVTDWLNIIWRNGLDAYTDSRDDFFPVLSAGENNGGRYVKETITRKQISSDLIGRTAFDITEDIDGNVLVGMNITHSELDDIASSARSFVNPFAPPSLANATNITDEDYQEVERSMGYYMQAGFGFYDQLYLNLSGRYDVLSTLPEDNNGIFYPSVDLAWQLSEIIPANNALSFAKLRAGFGQVGRGPGPYVLNTGFIPPIASIAGYGEGWGPGVSGVGYGGSFAQSNVAGNPDIKPEITTEIEFGTDLRFVRDRAYLSATYYSNTTNDLIIEVATPNSTGFEAQVDNVAQIKNNGIELELGGDLVATEDFKWTLYANWTRNRNEVTDMGGTESVLLSGFAGTSSNAVEGHALGVLWGDMFDRDENGVMILDDLGFPTIADEVGVIGDPNPDWRAGVGSAISYKGLDFNFLWDMSVGGEMWNGTRGALTFFGRDDVTTQETTLSADEASTLVNYFGITVADYYPYMRNDDGSYTVRGTVQDFGGGDVFLDEMYYLAGPGSGFTGPAEQFIEDASWYRLREVSLGYTFNDEAFRKATKLHSAKLSITGRNLLLFTAYTGNDPNQSLTGSGNNGFGLDYFQNPSTRSVAISLNITY